jgi:hypothetical protein
MEVSFATGTAGLPGIALEVVSKLGLRSEGPTINRPGRQAGINLEDWMSAEGATHAAVPHLRCSFH